ncbi:hypothetical protein ColLi_11422 [Colletotrichum liriopes]|uniref:Uncharacterized protein n=1 Tax=Colletotrichum liriopes TaxID=708192 RepID=A0AA37LXQ0_9PEZI|nr:hypothetical protein ColLi_11422 [Colletotrichum liriopes]
MPPIPGGLNEMRGSGRRADARYPVDDNMLYAESNAVGKPAGTFPDSPISVSNNPAYLEDDESSLSPEGRHGSPRYCARSGRGGGTEPEQRGITEEFVVLLQKIRSAHRDFFDINKHPSIDITLPDDLRTVLGTDNERRIPPGQHTATEAVASDMGHKLIAWAARAASEQMQENRTISHQTAADMRRDIRGLSAKTSSVFMLSPIAAESEGVGRHHGKLKQALANIRGPGGAMKLELALRRRVEETETQKRVADDRWARAATAQSVAEQGIQDMEKDIDMIAVELESLVEAIVELEKDKALLVRSRLLGCIEAHHLAYEYFDEA